MKAPLSGLFLCRNGRRGQQAAGQTTSHDLCCMNQCLDRNRTQHKERSQLCRAQARDRAHPCSQRRRTVRGPRDPAPEIQRSSIQQTARTGAHQLVDVAKDEGQSGRSGIRGAVRHRNRAFCSARRTRSSSPGRPLVRSALAPLPGPRESPASPGLRNLPARVAGAPAPGKPPASSASSCHDQPAVGQETARPVRGRSRSISHRPPTLTTSTTPSTPHTPTTRPSHTAHTAPPAANADAAPNPSVHREQATRNKHPSHQIRPPQLPRSSPSPDTPGDVHRPLRGPAPCFVTYALASSNTARRRKQSWAGPRCSRLVNSVISRPRTAAAPTEWLLWSRSGSAPTTAL
jgi:hypothetical protein